MKRVVAPAPAISLPEAKLHLRVDHNADDMLIAGLIESAAAHFDGWNGILARALNEQTWEASFDVFPSKLPLGPVASVASIKYDDPDGVEQTCADFDVVGGGLQPAASWPATSGRPGCVRVRWAAGEGCPADIKSAMLLFISHAYDNRSAGPVHGGIHALAHSKRGIAL